MHTHTVISASCLAMIAIFAGGGPALSDSADECAAALGRAQYYVPQLNVARDECRDYRPPAYLSEEDQDLMAQDVCAKGNQICDAMDPNSGARACLEAQNRPAYDYLSNLYNMCNVQ